jgi:hypothetical protein
MAKVSNCWGGQEGRRMGIWASRQVDRRVGGWGSGRHGSAQTRTYKEDGDRCLCFDSAPNSLPANSPTCLAALMQKYPLLFWSLMHHPVEQYVQTACAHSFTGANL